jgi:hypothetical protein
MDPFAALPLELAVHVLTCVEPNGFMRPETLGPVLLVSRRWNAVALQPELWSYVAMLLHNSPSDNTRTEIKRLLSRTRGGLAVLHVSGDVYSDSLWEDEGLMREATSRGALAYVSLDTRGRLQRREVHHDRIVQIANALGSASLETFHIEVEFTIRSAPALELARGILAHCPHVRDFKFWVSYDVGTKPLAATGTSSCQDEDRFPPPLRELEDLGTHSLSPWLWEHLSRVGAKLESVALLCSDYSSAGIAAHDPSGRLVQHILDVISGPRLRDFTYAGTSEIHPSVQTVVFDHPRRFLNIQRLGGDVAIGPGSMCQLEVLDLRHSNPIALHRILTQRLPRLRKLRLIEFQADDAVLAKTLGSVCETLQSLTLAVWRDPPTVHNTLSAVETLHALRRLNLQSCPGVTHAMLEPLLIGTPPTEPPKCPRVRKAYIRLDVQSSQFIARLRESIRSRFPNASDHDVDGL